MSIIYEQCCSSKSRYLTIVKQNLNASGDGIAKIIRGGDTLSVTLWTRSWIAGDSSMPSPGYHWIPAFTAGNDLSKTSQATVFASTNRKRFGLQIRKQ